MLGTCVLHYPPYEPPDHLTLPLAISHRDPGLASVPAPGQTPQRGARWRTISRSGLSSRAEAAAGDGEVVDEDEEEEAAAEGRATEAGTASCPTRCRSSCGTRPRTPASSSTRRAMRRWIVWYVDKPVRGASEPSPFIVHVFCSPSLLVQVLVSSLPPTSLPLIILFHHLPRLYPRLVLPRKSPSLTVHTASMGTDSDPRPFLRRDPSRRAG